MRRNGFSLVELVVVIAVMVTLMAIGGLVYSKMTRKTGIESQVKAMYADLMTARSQALYRKSCRYVTMAGTQFSVYTSSSCGATAPTTGAIVQKTLKYGLSSNITDSICFDWRGVANRVNSTNTDMSGTYKAICVQPNDPNLLTSIVVSPTGIQMGRLSAGGACNSVNITIQ